MEQTEQGREAGETWVKNIQGFGFYSKYGGKPFQDF